MSKFSKSLVASVIIVALGAPAIASATPQRGLENTAVKVSYADLNLQKAAGAEVLYRRLQIAARQACGVQSLTTTGSLRNFSETRSCYRDALSAAVAKIDNERVSEIHAG